MLSEQLYFTHIEKIICVTRYLCLPCSPESKLHKVRDLDHCAHYWSICLTQCLALGSINICWIIGWAAEPFIMNYFSKICQIFIGFYYPAFIYPSSWINIIFSLEKYSTPYSKPRVICPQYLISLASDLVQDRVNDPRQTDKAQVWLYWNCWKRDMFSSCWSC